MPIKGILRLIGLKNSFPLKIDMIKTEQIYHGPDDGGNFECNWENTYLSAHMISDVGKKRERNEDSCILCAPQDEGLLECRGYLFAIADGMGGASAGEHASRLALSTFSEQFYNGAETNIPNHVQESIESANEHVFAEAEQHAELSGMGTTLSTVAIVGDCAYIGQVGDSRVYLQRPKADLLQITEDHSLVAEQVRGGIISEEEARNHSLKNLITRAIGIKEDVEVDLFSLRLQKGDTLLICSDGLCNMVEDDDIANALQVETLQTAARLLVGKALEAGGSDNISVALVRVVGVPPKKNLQAGGSQIYAPPTGFWNSLKGLFS